MPTEETSTTSTISSPADSSATGTAPSAPVDSGAAESSVSVSAPESGSSSATLKGDEFADALRSEMQSYFDSSTFTDLQNKTPSQPEQKPQTQQQHPVEQPQEPQQQNEAQNPEEQKQPEAEEEEYHPQYDENGREIIPAIYIQELNREVTLEELIDKFKGFDYYHANALKQQEDAKRLAEASQQLEQQKAELQARLDEFSSSKNDPMMKIVQLFKNDPELKKEVTNLVRKLRPNGMRSIDGKTRAEARQAEWQSLQEKVAKLESAEAQRLQAVQQQQRANEVRIVSDAVQNHVNSRVKELSQHGIQVTEQELKAIADAYLPMMQTKGYNVKDVTEHFDNYFRLLANKSQQLINNYQQIKRAAPPAPPSGGAAPTITPTPIRGREDFESTLASRLSELMRSV